MPAVTLKALPLEDPSLPKANREEIADTIALMRIQEETTYRVVDYLQGGPVAPPGSKPVDADCRVKMCEWCYQVVDFCKFRRETVSTAMSYLDRYLTTSPTRSRTLANRKEYQLVAMTALYIAIKLNEPMEMDTSLLAELSRGCYTEMEFVKMEQTLLAGLKFRVNGPTILAFVQHYVALLPRGVHIQVANTIMDYAAFQTELAISEHSFVAVPLSQLGLAAVLNAVEGIDSILMSADVQRKFTRNLEKYAEMTIEEVHDLQVRLSWMLSQLFQQDCVNYVKSKSDYMHVDSNSKFFENYLSPGSVIPRT